MCSRSRHYQVLISPSFLEGKDLGHTSSVSSIISLYEKKRTIRAQKGGTMGPDSERDLSIRSLSTRVHCSGPGGLPWDWFYMWSTTRWSVDSAHWSPTGLSHSPTQVFSQSFWEVFLWKLTSWGVWPQSWQWDQKLSLEDARPTCCPGNHVTSASIRNQLKTDKVFHASGCLHDNMLPGWKKHSSAENKWSWTPSLVACG